MWSGMDYHFRTSHIWFLNYTLESLKKTAQFCKICHSCQNESFGVWQPWHFAWTSLECYLTSNCALILTSIVSMEIVCSTNRVDTVLNWFESKKIPAYDLKWWLECHHICCFFRNNLPLKCNWRSSFISRRKTEYSFETHEQFSFSIYLCFCLYASFFSVAVIIVRKMRCVWRNE